MNRAADVPGSYAVGVELGGTKSVALLGQGPAAIRDEFRVPTGSAEETLGRLAERVAGWQREVAVGAIGIASFGPIDLDPRSPRFGRMRATPKPGWQDADVLAPFRGLRVPLALDTDVNAAAIAEGHWGAGRGLSDFAYITVGTGVGVGSIVAGQSVRGGGHSEAGHQRVPRLAGDAWPGACPFHGDCVEGLASGRAIGSAFGASGPIPQDWPGWQRAVEALALLIHNLVLTTAPRRVIIGGGVMEGQPWLLHALDTRLKASLAGYAHAADLPPDFLCPPELGPRSGPLGALALGLDQAGRMSRS